MNASKYKSQRKTARRSLAASRANPPIRAGLPRYLSMTVPRSEVRIGKPGDRLEREADRIAHRVAGADTEPGEESLGGGGKGLLQAGAIPASGPAAILGHKGRPLDESTRTHMESRFGVGFGQVRVHTDAQASSLNRDLGSHAFTQGLDIFYASGHAPARDALTAHELAHVVQQNGGLETNSALGTLSAQADGYPVQCSFTGSYRIPGSSDGGFEIDLQTREGAVATPPTQSGMDGYIRFVPAPGAPNSNVLAFTQIVKLTDAGGTDVDPLSMPPAQAPRGALGTPGLRTEEDALLGIEGGFFTDVHHRPNAASPGAPQGSALSPRYHFQPAAPGTAGTAGQTRQPAQYGGGIGGVVGQTPGFKRSDDPADIRSAVMYDFPGTSSATANLDFEFETVALGEDTMITYGGVEWGFGLRAGRVVNEHLNVNAGQSATFGEALERHRDFYVHEPVSFYFGFASDMLSAAEAAKIDTFLPYLRRNPDVELSLEGFADQVGGASVYNRNLSRRRALAVRAELLARGIDAGRLSGIVVSHGASTAATANAGTGDQSGNAALGADQSREANRWANRRVVLTFRHTASAGP